MAPHQTPSSSSSSPPLKILMIHGYTQNGPLFRAKTRALEKHMHKSFPGSQLFYPTAPIRIHAADLAASISNFDSHSSSSSAIGEVQALSEPDAFGWWIRQGSAEPYVYNRMDEGFALLAKVLKNDGPFDGVIGFSQGGALAGMLASLLERDRYRAFEDARKDGGMAYPPEFLEVESTTNSNTSINNNSSKNGENTKKNQIHPPLKFAVSYAGFGATTNALYLPFYTPPIATPLLHFLGSLDTVVEEARSLRLVNACEERFPLPLNNNQSQSNTKNESDTGSSGATVFQNDESYKAARVVYHPGGHFLPAGKQYLAVLEGFIREVMGRYHSSNHSSSDAGTISAGSGNSNRGKKEEEERVEDMDVPF